MREGLGCVDFIYKIVEIMAASSDNGWWPNAWAVVCGTAWSVFLLYTLIFSLSNIF